MKIVTSLSFRGQCREAFEFYAKVLGGNENGVRDNAGPIDRNNLFRFVRHRR